jgi:hypothetical protein
MPHGLQCRVFDEAIHQCLAQAFAPRRSIDDHIEHQEKSNRCKTKDFSRTF